MRAIVLGSAAGGGFPQWNCGCRNCTAVRERAPGFLPRTQDSLAITADEQSFALINASPDILAQIKATPELWPRAPRHSPIRAIILTNGDMDHVLGLFSLRESQPLALYAAPSVWRGLRSSVLLRTLQRFDGQLVFRALELEKEVELRDAAGEPLGLVVRAMGARGKLPVHLVGHATESPDDNIALSVTTRTAGATTTRSSLAYAAACSSVDGLSLDGHDVVLFDGTFYREDELVSLGLSRALAKDMAHMPIDGASGSLQRLASLRARKIYTHINNTNPLLSPDSEERRAVERAGWEIAVDGMSISS